MKVDKLNFPNLNLLSGRTDQFMLYNGHGASYLYISLRFGVALCTAMVTPKLLKGSGIKQQS